MYILQFSKNLILSPIIVYVKSQYYATLIFVPGGLMIQYYEFSSIRFILAVYVH